MITVEHLRYAMVVLCSSVISNLRPLPSIEPRPSSHLSTHGRLGSFLQLGQYRAVSDSPPAATLALTKHHILKDPFPDEDVVWGKYVDFDHTLMELIPYIQALRT